ncbi:protein of unknown function [Burkholderia multivorans]
MPPCGQGRRPVRSDARQLAARRPWHRAPDRRCASGVREILLNPAANTAWFFSLARHPGKIRKKHSSRGAKK